jgi:hypothetical protein
MADISKCNGYGCKKRDTCYRFTAPNSDYQSYFSIVPVARNGECGEYWPNTGREVVIEKPAAAIKPFDRVVERVWLSPSGHLSVITTQIPSVSSLKITLALLNMGYEPLGEL